MTATPMAYDNFSREPTNSVGSSAAIRRCRTSQAHQTQSEAELEADRSAAAIALNAAYLRQRESRFGKVSPRVTATDVLAEALKDAQERE
jgi:hypothetical protein